MDKAEKQKILEELGGIPEEFYDEIVKEFIGQAHAQVKTIREALQNNDFDTASKVAHSVKGSSGNLRIYKLQELSKFIELESKANPSKKQELEDHASRLEVALGEFEKEFLGNP